MFMRHLFWLLAPLGYSAALCFPESIPESGRQFIQDESGSPVPIRIGSFGWNLAIQVSALADLLISEVLGYHVTTELVGSPGYEELLLKIAGCTSMACNETTNAVHIVVEAPPGNPATLESFRFAYPSRAPQDLGGMGYIFTWGIYVKGASRDAAFQDAALALEYYRNYNTSVNQPQKYFQGLPDLDMEDFIFCNDTSFGDDFINTRLWANYLKWTGDTEGVTETPEGFVATCQDGRFWMAPACRSNPSHCIPVISAWQVMNHFAQWATVHNLPFAFGRPAPGKLQDLIRKYDVLHYWWEPDEGELTDLAISRLLLPAHNAAEYKDGNFRTAGEGIALKKYGSSSLERFAPRVKGLVEGIATSPDAILRLSTSISLAEAGPLSETFFRNQEEARGQICAWAKSNRDVWEPWLPIVTNCISGFGLVNGRDEPVDLREEAVGCRLCPAGRSSQFYVDTTGPTHRCVLCLPGQHQSQIGKEQCQPCDPGTFSATPGQALCSPCPPASYASAGGMASCLRCNETDQTTTALIEDTWIEIQGATSESYCHCVPGRFLHEGTCSLCGVGTSCPGSDALEVLPGFHSTDGNPGLVFQCFNDPERCPGGLPGTCASGRDTNSPGCSECLPGLQPSSAVCIPCSGGDYFRMTAYALLVLFATGILHVLFFTGGHGSNQLQSKLVTAALCLSHLITFAQLFAVMRQIQAVQWADPFLSFLAFIDIFSLETLLHSVRSISCFTSLTPEANFLIRAIFLPVFFAVGPCVSHIICTVAAKKHTWQVSTLLGTLGSLCLLFFIMICFVCIEPFRCNSHPNGFATMQTAPSIFCDFTGEHVRLCLFGGILLVVPLSFLALSTWIIKDQLPKRVAKGDTEFIRMTSFLTMRFKPGYEVFTVIFMLRNVLIPVTPMLPSASASLLVMGLLLIGSAALVSYYKPWRSLLTTIVDLIGQAILLLILLLAALTVTDQDYVSVMILCTTAASTLVAVILLAAGYCAVQFLKSKFRKPFRYFLCHHKASTAAFTRWLKMELQGCGFKVFIDLDSLTDLTALFSYVSSKVETFVILGSPSIATRKWCVGEMVTARLSNVETVLVSLPNFLLPKESFIKEIASNMPEVVELTAYGYGLSEVKETLRWLGTVRTISINEVSSASMDQLVGELTKKRINHTADALLRSVGGCILVDHENAEAVASGYVLARFLGPMMVDRGMPITVLGPETPEIQLQQVQPRVLILMCSQNCMKSASMVKCLLTTRFLNSCSVLPVISDEGFEVPQYAGPEDSEDAEAVRSILAAVFLEVAPPYMVGSFSEDDLAIRASQIARRLSPGTLKSLRSKLWMTSTTHESDLRATCYVQGASTKSAESIVEVLGNEQLAHPRDRDQLDQRDAYSAEVEEEMVFQAF